MSLPLLDEIPDDRAYLLTWNPDDWELTAEEYYARVLITATTGGFMNGWTLGTNFRQIEAGSEVFSFVTATSGGSSRTDLRSATRTRATKTASRLTSRRMSSGGFKSLGRSGSPWKSD